MSVIGAFRPPLETVTPVSKSKSASVSFPSVRREIVRAVSE